MKREREMDVNPLSKLPSKILFFTGSDMALRIVFIGNLDPGLIIRTGKEPGANKKPHII